MTVNELFETWINYKGESIKRRTFCRYSEVIKKYISPYIGNMNVQDVDPKCLQDLMLKIYKKDGEVQMAASTYNGIISVLKSGCDHACDIELIDHNPCARIKRLPLEGKKVEAFTRTEQEMLEKYILTSEKEYYFGVLLCLYTGLRIGELLALEWRDYDYERGILHINKTVYRSKNKNGEWRTFVDTPKTRSSERIIPLPYYLNDLFINHMERSNSRFIVSNRAGSRMTTRSYQKIFKNLCVCADVKVLNFHALRHTFATRAVECGMDIKTLSEIMGHKSATLTLNRYAHSMIDTKIEMMNRMPRWF